MLVIFFEVYDFFSYRFKLKSTKEKSNSHKQRFYRICELIFFWKEAYKFIKKSTLHDGIITFIKY